MKKNQRGMGLLELMFTLAIIAVLLLVAVKYYRVVRIGASSDEAVKKIMNIVAASERWGAGHSGSFSEITGINKLTEAGLLPEDFSTNEWGGKIDVKALSSSKIRVSIDQLSSQVCYNLGQKLGIQESDLDAQCITKSEDAYTTLFYCYPDQKACQS